MADRFLSPLELAELSEIPEAPSEGYVKHFVLGGRTYSINSDGLVRELSSIPDDYPVFIQEEQPDTSENKYLWIQTNINGNPEDFTFWFEDGI